MSGFSRSDRPDRRTAAGRARRGSAIGSSSDRVRTAISPASSPPAARATMSGERRADRVGSAVGQPEHDRLEPEGRPKADHPRRPAHQRAAVGDLLHDPVGEREDERRRERAGLRQVEPERPEERLRERRSDDDPEDREQPEAERGDLDDPDRRPAQVQAGGRVPAARPRAPRRHPARGRPRPGARPPAARRSMHSPPRSPPRPAATIRPQHRLRATGTGAAHAQRTGASRRIATSVPATSATSTASRVSRTAAARRTSRIGRNARAAAAGSRGRTPRTVTGREAGRCCR